MIFDFAPQRVSVNLRQQFMNLKPDEHLMSIDMMLLNNQSFNNDLIQWSSIEERCIYGVFRWIPVDTLSGYALPISISTTAADASRYSPSNPILCQPLPIALFFNLFYPVIDIVSSSLPQLRNYYIHWITFLIHVPLPPLIKSFSNTHINRFRLLINFIWLWTLFERYIWP